jgi:hypothetical protein
MAARSNRREVRNPILGLPDARAALAELEPAQAEALARVLLAIQIDARARADESWRRHKGPMAAYWKAAGVYCGHIAKAIRLTPRQEAFL